MHPSLFLLALVGACLAQFDTRNSCPPEGYTAIFASTNLAHLPPHGNYAICLTEAQDLAVGLGGTGPFPFAPLGVWKMSNSKLIVDFGIQIEVNFPARLEWDNVLVTTFAPSVAVGTGAFQGISLTGAYDSTHPHSPYSRIEYGNCGSLNHVRIEGVENTDPGGLSPPGLTISNCTSKTTVKNVHVHDAAGGFDFEHSNGIIAYDLLSTSIANNLDGIIVEHSQIAFIGPDVSATGVGFRIFDGSNVTICSPFVGTETGPDFLLGDDDATHFRNSVAVAGLYNSVFPDDLGFGTNSGGLLYGLVSCPKKFKPLYPAKEWDGFYPG